MSRTEKLLGKLRNETIAYREMVTLLGKLGWTMRGQAGSHEQWTIGPHRFTLTKDFPRYQRRLLKKLILGE